MTAALQRRLVWQIAPGRPSHFWASLSRSRTAFCRRNDLVVLQTQLVFSPGNTDEVWRIFEHQFVFSRQVRVARHHAGCDRRAGGLQRGLTRNKRAHRDVVVCEALDVDAARCNSRQLHISDRAACDADRFSGEIGRPFDNDIFRFEHGLEERRIGSREVDELFSLRIFAERGDYEVSVSSFADTGYRWRW